MGLPDGEAVSSRTGVFLKRAFRAAILLSETAAVMPPGFFLESDIGFEIVSQDAAFIDKGLVELPMRELRLGDLIEKKRIEYAPARSEFSGLYDDERLRLFDDLSPNFVDRTTKIGIEATDRWVSGPDVDENWKDILATLSPAAIEVVRQAPTRLRENGAALTWPALIEYLNSESLHHQGPVRRALQQNYFELYIREYGLSMLHQLPYKFDAFIPLGTIRQYPYRTFLQVLHCLGMSHILELSALDIVHVRSQPGWAQFADSFVQLASEPDVPPTNVMNAFHTSSNAQDVRKLASTLFGQLQKSNELMISELMGEVGLMSDDVARRFRLLVRSTRRSTEVSESYSFKAHRNRDVVTATDKARGDRQMKDIFIITSNENENRAVLAELAAVANNGELVPDVSLKSDFSKVSATIKTKTGTARVDVAIARETGGVIAANLLRRRALSGRSLDAVFVIGCAGLLMEKYNRNGSNKKSSRGLVVLAKKASDGDARLVEDAGTISRADGFHGDRRLIEAFRTLNGMDAFRNDGITLITNREFISTAAFIASDDSEERRRLVDQFVADAIVVENEAFWIYDEVQNLQSETGVILPCLVIKGISDLGDEDALVDKVEKQKEASANAAKVVFRLVREQ